MTHPEDDRKPDPQTPPEESDTQRHDKQPDERHDERHDPENGLSPEAKKIEEDPSLNPDNEVLRDIRGG